jgi:hypothetical protein
MSEVTEVLVAARELIVEPDRWTKRTLAANEEGVGVDPTSEEAVCWCTVGAIQKAAASANNPDELEHLAVRAMFNTYIPYYPLGDWNDGSTHELVLSVFDKAIELSNSDV